MEWADWVVQTGLKSTCILKKRNSKRPKTSWPEGAHGWAFLPFCHPWQCHHRGTRPYACKRSYNRDKHDNRKIYSLRLTCVWRKLLNLKCLCTRKFYFSSLLWFCCLPLAPCLMRKQAHGDGYHRTVKIFC